MSAVTDQNLRLTLLQAMWNEGLAPKFDKPAFYRNQLSREYDPASPEHEELNVEVRDALIATDLPEDSLARLKRVDWDGSEEIFHLIWEFPSDVGDTFFVKSLSGIEACKNLGALQFFAGLKTTNLSPIASLAELTTLRLQGPQRQTDIPPLLGLPKLKLVDVPVEDNESCADVVAQLRAKGVQVSGG